MGLRGCVIAMGLLLVLTGCSAGTGSVPGSWIARQGGLDDSTPDRVAAVAARVIGQHSHVRVSVLNADELCAYAWPDGSIFVTRGLVDRLDDAELAAAIAHELGHLYAGGHLPPPSSLVGRPAHGDVELEADLIGQGLLSDAAVSPQSMVTMLEKVQASADLDAQTRRDIARRIAALRASR